MQDQLLKQYILTRYSDDDQKAPVFLSTNWTGRNPKKLQDLMFNFTISSYIEDDELMFIKNRDDSDFYTVRIGDYIVIDEHFHVFPIPNKQFLYLFKEKLSDEQS